jgi:hypothetical protein
MTTGRINQVTIVRRKRPPAPLGAPESFQVTDRTQKGAPRYRGLGVSAGARSGRSSFPPQIPQGILPPHEISLGRRVAWEPQEEDPTAAHLPWRCQRCAVTPRCSVICLANGQAPTEPILRRSMVQDQRRVGVSFSSRAARRSGQGPGS